MQKKKFFSKTLRNGMKIIFEQRKGSGIVSLAFAARYGGINETKAEKGITHFIEHMLFKGTINRTAKQLSEEIEKRGGVLNGFTEEEIVAYWCKMPSEHLNIALDVLSDMIKNSKFEKKEVEKERKVIFEEMKMYKDNPRLYVMDKIKEMLYRGDFSIPLIGTEESMRNNTREKLIEKFKQIHNPKNMIMCAVGDADFKKLCDYCEKNFIGGGKKFSYSAVQLKNEQIIEKRKGIDQANLIFAFHIPSASNKEVYSSILLNAIMADGMSSRLFQEIREKRNLAYAVKGSCNIGKNFGYMMIYAGSAPENVNEIKKIILEEFGKIEKLTEKELNQAKEQLIGNNRISKEDSQGQMLELLIYEIFGKAKESYEYEKKIKQVKLEYVKKLAKNALKAYSFIALIPDKTAKEIK